MTNEDILNELNVLKTNAELSCESSHEEGYREDEIYQDGISEGIAMAINLLEVQQKNEHEKMQGVDVWVSWDKHRRQEVYPVLTFTEPSEESRPSYFTYYKTDDETYAELTPKEAETLGVSPGQCKKFRIVELKE